MKTRIVHTKFWNDAYVRSLTPTESLFYFYLISNEFINVLHLYELPVHIASFQTKINPKEIEKIKEKLKKDNKIDFFEEWIFLINADKYSYYKGIKNNALKLRLLVEMDKTSFKYFRGHIDNVVDGIISETRSTSVQDSGFLTLLTRVMDRVRDSGIDTDIDRGIDSAMSLEEKLATLSTPDDRGIDRGMDTNKKPETRNLKSETRNADRGIKEDNGYAGFKKAGEILRKHVAKN